MSESLYYRKVKLNGKTWKALYNGVARFQEAKTITSQFNSVLLKC